VDTDRNLLFGVLALQADLLDQARFVEACTLWASRKQAPLADLLVERGWLSAEDRTEIDKLLERKLKKHGGDARAGLSDLTTDRVRKSLADIADPDVQASLVGETPLGPDSVSTAAYVPPAGERYTLTRLHATGGIGRVWLARDTSLGRDVALKDLRPERAGSAAVGARFLNEAMITGQLEHPGIVPIYEVGRRPDDQAPYYTMRFVRGRTLAAAAASYHEKHARGEAGPLELRELLGAFVSVCNAMAYAHARGVLHRDLKPQNVVLGEYGEVIVLDWGVARLLDRPEEEAPPVIVTDSDTEATLEGQVVGTPAYMAPEQAEGRLDQLGPATDVYGLGAILYEILTGRPPFVATAAATVLDQVVHDAPARPRQLVPETAPALEAVCLKALAKKPADRYSSARALADDVRHWLADEPVAACREPWTARAGRWARRHRTLVASGGVLLVAAVVALSTGVVLLGREQARTERARQEAREHFRRSRDVVDRMLVRFADSPDGLRDAPGMTTARRQIVEEALAYYQEFLETDSADPDVRHEAGRAYMLLGRVRRQAGKDKEAEKAYIRARELLAGLAADFPTISSYRLDLAQCRTRLGSLYQEVKRFAEAGAEYRAAVSLAERLAAERPDEPKARFQLATSHNSLGTSLRAMGADAAAEAEYRESLRVALELAARPGATPDERGIVAHARNNLANVYTARTEWSKALAELNAVVAVWRGLAEEFPRVPDHRGFLASAEANRINPLLQLGRKDDAVKAAGASLALRRRLADDFPTVPGYQADLAQAHFNRGVALRDAGNLGEAEKSLKLAVEAGRKLARDLPHLPDYRLSLAISHSTLAQLRDRLGQPKEAEEGHRAALAELRTLVADHGSVRPYRSRLADQANSLASFLINHDRAAEAEEPLGEATRLWRDLVREEPDEPAYSSDLGMALGNLAAVLSRRPDLAGARRLLEEADACHARALKLAPKNAHYREWAARELARLADCALSQGDHAAGVAAAEKRLALLEDRTDTYYSLACACGRAMAAAEKDKALSEARRAELTRAYADRAVACLREVQRYRPLIIIGASLEKDLAPLRARVDLKTALANPPPTTGKKSGR
jgi:tetratricopeptide (TPR) repeat protein/tRNA A-37 threonylcarbamoyl transferase component Bud32